MQLSSLRATHSFNLWSLIDSDFAVYMLIHIRLVNKVCKKLEIQFILLTKKKLIWNYDEKLFKKVITHKILLNLTIESHKKLTMSMLIVDIEHHEAILSKLWMNKNEILLNMWHDAIIFSDQLNTSISIFSISLNMKHLSWLQSTLISSAAHDQIFKMLKHLVLIIRKESFLDWLRQVKSLRSSWVLDSSRLNSSQNSWFKYLSQVRRFNLSI